MISEETETFVRRLLAGKKLSYRKIAKLAKVCRTTVKVVSQRKPEKVVTKPAHNVGPFSKQASRCPECGASAYFPEDSVVCYECLITNDKGAKNACKSNG